LSLRPQTSRKIIKALSDLGFEIARKHGSHVVMKHADGRITVIPVHARENIGVGLLVKIMKDAKLDRDEFIKLLVKT
jgi:predicted RNA binding protein YcfA (HicA-like mRNA interferase family)